MAILHRDIDSRSAQGESPVQIFVAAAAALYVSTPRAFSFALVDKDPAVIPDLCESLSPM